LSKIYLLLGGTRSGKSTFGEKLAASFSDKVAYIATAKITDKEMEKRIVQHRKRRPAYWKTYEIKNFPVRNKDIDNILANIKSEKINTLLIDCITNLLFAVIDEYDLSDRETVSNKVEEEIEKKVISFFKVFLSKLQSSNLNIIMISNEIGMGVVPAFPLGRIFRDLMGIINKEISSVANEVYLFIAGLKQRLK